MAERTLNRFPDHSMMTLTSERVRYDLAESVGPDLCLSDLLSPQELADLGTVSLEYKPAAGSAELRALIASQHSVDADDIVTMAGGMLAIFLCGTILCNDGDHVLVQQPSFPLTQTALAFNNATVEGLPCRFAEGYRVDVDDLVARLTPQTSLVCLASPQNPSGVAIGIEDITLILNAMHDRSPNAFLLLDETYRQASYGDDQPIASFASLDERIISCASLSKCHGAPGLRIGWAITRHKSLRQQLLNGKFQTIICGSGLDEALALRVLQRSETLFAHRRSHLQQGRQLVAEWVEHNSSSLSWVAPDAGALCCVRLKNTDNRAITGFYDGLSQQSVRVAPGPWFGDEPQVFRLGFGLLTLNELSQGLEAINHVLNQ